MGTGDIWFVHHLPYFRKYFSFVQNRAQIKLALEMGQLSLLRKKNLEGLANTMVSVSTIQSSLNQELLFT